MSKEMVGTFEKCPLGHKSVAALRRWQSGWLAAGGSRGQRQHCHDSFGSFECRQRCPDLSFTLPQFETENYTLQKLHVTIKIFVVAQF